MRYWVGGDFWMRGKRTWQTKEPPCSAHIISFLSAPLVAMICPQGDQSKHQTCATKGQAESESRGVVWVVRGPVRRARCWRCGVESCRLCWLGCQAGGRLRDISHPVDVTLDCRRELEGRGCRYVLLHLCHGRVAHGNHHVNTI